MFEYFRIHWNVVVSERRIVYVWIFSPPTLCQNHFRHHFHIPSLFWHGLRTFYHVELLAPKLSRAIGMLSKIRHFVQRDTLRTIYFGIFSSILIYGSQIWGNHHNIHINRKIKLQDKALRILNCAHYRAPTSPLYKNPKILKFRDNITLNNFIFVHDSFKGILPHILINNFVYLQNLHDHNTRITISCKTTKIQYT